MNITFNLHYDGAMPEMPTFLADLLVPRFGRRAEVIAIEPLTPTLRSVWFAGEQLRGIAFRPGQEVELRVGPRSLRHYTPRRLDPSTGTLEIWFYLHAGGGPGAQWATELAPGGAVDVLGPGGRFGLDPDAAGHVLLGDETCFGLFAALADAARVTTRITGAVEVGRADAAWPTLGGRLDLLERTGARGAALQAWLAAAAQPAATTYYLAGHTGTVKALREQLLASGVSRAAIRTKAYWADGKRGL